MKQRVLGSTGKTISEIGLGSWQLGNAKDWDVMSEKEGIELVHHALSLGCNFFDTAPNYGLGKSEEILGKALKGKRNEVIISSKFGHQDDGSINFDPHEIENSVHKSLKRLQTDYLDTLLLHNPPFEYLNGGSHHFEVLEKLKREGKILSYGASVDSSKEMFQVIETTNSQVMEVMFNIFHQETSEAFKAAKENGIGLIIKVPLDSGWLSGKYGSNSTFTDIRRRWSKDIIERRTNMLKEIKKIVDPSQSLTQSALQFILAHEEVSTIIPGAKNIIQLNENVSASQGMMDETKVEQLKSLWKKHLQNNSLPW
ncbi:aldo/keto reductase [Evansella cellulosilytica]|uniref:Aldo/keto reductase n=1 Tax=Evansella cellulosilytica (strain ATCC 21833 / DSM 2522 / FERM P-1141 / JCM 9156 / N-4) TaxID=649639 RepID=E6TYC2_EVAC2|nr:aldo/keto reductase [Evansella cellulosilytica]ADU28860.1 aldo/keto reductase [Evansella cellulosilytica DSM 2522]